MNLQDILEALIGSARRIGAEKVLLSKFDVSATKIRTAPCEDFFIERAYPQDPSGMEVEDPIFYASDAVAWSELISRSTPVLSAAPAVSGVDATGDAFAANCSPMVASPRACAGRACSATTLPSGVRSAIACVPCRNRLPLAVPRSTGTPRSSPNWAASRPAALGFFTSAPTRTGLRASAAGAATLRPIPTACPVPFAYSPEANDSEDRSITGPRTGINQLMNFRVPVA